MFKVTVENYKANHLPQELLEKAYEKKWFKLFLPKSLSGLESDLNEGLSVLEETSRLFGGLGWAINLGAGAGYFHPFYEFKTAIQLFNPKDSVIAGSGFVGGSAVKTREGYILNGTWPKCSGSAHATLFTANAADGNDEVLSFTLLDQQVQIVEDCSMFGLKSTSSQSIKVKDALIPEKYVFKIGEVKINSEYKLYNLPFDLFARFCMGSTYIGICYCFLDHLKEGLIVKNKELVKLITELENELAKFKEILFELSKKYWLKAMASDGVLQIETNEVPELLAEKTKKIYQYVNTIYYYGGLRLSNESELAHWAFRDVLTASQHYLFK